MPQKRNRNTFSESQTSVANAKDFIVVQGEVLELRPGATFLVRLENGYEILCHLSGKMRMFKIKILPGDKVKIEMRPHDLTKGRITYPL